MKSKIVGTMKLSDIERMRIDAKQEGIKEVVDWIKNNAKYNSMSGQLYCNGRKWKAKLTEWGLNNE